MSMDLELQTRQFKELFQVKVNEKTQILEGIIARKAENRVDKKEYTLVFDQAACPSSKLRFSHLSSYLYQALEKGVKP